MNEPAVTRSATSAGGVAVLPRTDQLDRALADASPAEIIAAALQAVGRERLAVVSSFGTESAALLKIAADVDPAIPSCFLTLGICLRRRWPIATRWLPRLACATSARSSRLRKICRVWIPIASYGSPIPMPAAGFGRSSRWHVHWGRSAPDQRPQAVSGRPAHCDSRGRGPTVRG